MARRYHDRNFSLFEDVGSSHKRYNLPLPVRRKLGFSFLGAIEEYIDHLVLNAADEAFESDHDGLSTDELLDLLRKQGRFKGMSRNQTLVAVIEDEFKVVNAMVEDEINTEMQRRGVQQLLSFTDYLERKGVLPDGG